MLYLLRLVEETKTKIFLLYKHRSETITYVSSHLRTHTLLIDIGSVMTIENGFVCIFEVLGRVNISGHWRP